MDYIQALIAGSINDPQVVAWVIYFIAALAGVTLAVALYFLFTGIYSPVKFQLEKLTAKDGVPAHANTWNDYSRSLEHNLSKVPLLNTKFAGDIETKRLLIHAGFHSENALKVFNAIKIILFLSAIFAAVALSKHFSELSTMVTFYLYALVIGSMYLLPAIILRHLANRRMSSLRRFFPDALDLLVVCCEAGLGLLEALQRVSKELELAHPYLAHEIGLVCSKVRVGFSMQQALQEFSDRTGLEDIRGLNSVIVQSLKLGTGIAETIRVYSDEYRDKRMQQAEENAAKLSVKMIFPMMFCIWPSFFIVAIGPAILKVMAVWDKAF
jgi:tight adherence protein C